MFRLKKVPWKTIINFLLIARNYRQKIKISSIQIRLIKETGVNSLINQITDYYILSKEISQEKDHLEQI